MKTKKEAFSSILNYLDNILGNNGCNDFSVDNNPEMFSLIEHAGADNLGMSIESFRKSDQYEDYKPHISRDNQRILTQDYVILALIKKELGL